MWLYSRITPQHFIEYYSCTNTMAICQSVRALKPLVEATLANQTKGPALLAVSKSKEWMDAKTGKEKE
jgi:hypothetical protein